MTPKYWILNPHCKAEHSGLFPKSDDNAEVELLARVSGNKPKRDGLAVR